MTTAVLLTTIGIIGGSLTVLVGVGHVLRGTVKGIRRINYFFDDWFGEPARNGQEARLGVAQRLAEVETRTAQLVNNGGGSMKDRVDRIEDSVKSIEESLRTGENAGAQLSSIESKLDRHITQGESVTDELQQRMSELERRRPWRRR